MKSPAFTLLAATFLVAGADLPAAAAEPKSPGQAVADYARKQEGKKVGSGECWDLAAAALDETGCAWTRPRDFGRALDLKKDALRPGDILQFENVTLKWRRGNRFGTIRLGFPQHTAIVLAADGASVEVAHQNYNNVRKVGTLTLNLAEITAGKVAAYRPVAKES